MAPAAPAASCRCRVHVPLLTTAVSAARAAFSPAIRVCGRVVAAASRGPLVVALIEEETPPGGQPAGCVRCWPLGLLLSRNVHSHRSPVPMGHGLCHRQGRLIGMMAKPGLGMDSARAALLAAGSSGAEPLLVDAICYVEKTKPKFLLATLPPPSREPAPPPPPLHNVIVHPRELRLLRPAGRELVASGQAGSAAACPDTGYSGGEGAFGPAGVALDGVYLDQIAAAKHGQMNDRAGGADGEVPTTAAKARRLYNQRKHRRTKVKRPQPLPSVFRLCSVCLCLSASPSCLGLLSPSAAATDLPLPPQHWLRGDPNRSGLNRPTARRTRRAGSQRSLIGWWRQRRVGRRRSGLGWAAWTWRVGRAAWRSSWQLAEGSAVWW